MNRYWPGILSGLIASGSWMTSLPAQSQLAVPDANAVVFVIDTSGSMRDPRTERFNAPVTATLEAILKANPQFTAYFVFDFDGRPIGTKKLAWMPRTADSESAILDAVQTYRIASNSNPAPAIIRAMKKLHPSSSADQRMTIWVLGDEFVDSPDLVLERLERINPLGSNGQRLATVNTAHFPWIRTDTPPGWAPQITKSCKGFADLMQEVARVHGGEFVTP